MNPEARAALLRLTQSAGVTDPQRVEDVRQFLGSLGTEELTDSQAPSAIVAMALALVDVDPRVMQDIVIVAAAVEGNSSSRDLAGILLDTAVEVRSQQSTAPARRRGRPARQDETPRFHAVGE